MAGETERPASTEEIISAYAKAHKFPAALALAVAEQESGFDNTAVSNKGARGIFQLMPETAAELGVDPDDPIQNIQGGIKYLKQLSDRYNGDVTKTLQAYNGGMGNLDRGTVSADAQVYATDVMARLSKRMRTQATSTVPATTSAGAVTTAAGAPPAARGPAGPAGAGGPTGRASGAGPVGTTVPSGADPFASPMSMLPTPGPILRSMAETVDPRTSEGRENLAGMAGGIAIGAVTGGAGSSASGVLPWVVRVLGPAIGAATGGATEAAVEQTIGTAPPSPTAVTEAGLRQGGYELLGQGMMWPVKRVVRGFLGSRVGRMASTALDEATAEARRTGVAAMDAVRARVTEGVEAARAMANATLEATREAGRRTVQTARESAGKQTADVTQRAGQMVTGSKIRASEIVAQTELDNASAIADITKQYDNLLANPPSTMEAGQLTKEAVEGPAKRALDMAGQRVSEAAKTGPAINMAPIKGVLDDMARKARPVSIFGEPGAKSTIPATGTVAVIPKGGTGAANTITGEEYRRMWAAELGVSESHPLPGLLGQIQAAPESLTFADAHKLKMLLDEGVNWDRTAKKHLEKITKGLRTTLRDALSVHEPYNVATAAYQAMVPLYRRGVGKRVIAAAVNNPDAIARTLNANNPAQALALRDLLLVQSAAGGDPVAGQRAWDAVRSSFVYNNVLDGGIKNLSERVHALVEQSPEFAKAVFHDENSQRIISNLDRLGQAYTAAVQAAEAKLAQSKATGTALVDASKTFAREEIAGAGTRGTAQTEAARQAAAEAIAQTRAQGTAAITATRKAGAVDLSTTRQAARAGVDAAKAQQQKLATSSLKKGTVTGQLADLMRAVFQGPKSVWGALSIVRLMEGPQAKDLLQWASYSDANTQRLINVVTGQVPDRMASALLRDVINALQIEPKHLEPDPGVTKPAPAATPAARQPQIAAR